MSRFNDPHSRHGAAALIIFAALGCSAVALASDEPVRSVTIGAAGADKSEDTKPAAGSEHAPGEKAAKAPRSLFRCWQGGRLIFEARGYGALPSSQVAAELKPSDNASGRVQVLDMYEGLCVLELPK